MSEVGAPRPPVVGVLTGLLAVVLVVPMLLAGAGGAEGTVVAVAPPTDAGAAVGAPRTIPTGAGTVVSGDGRIAAYDCSAPGLAQLCTLGLADEDTRLLRPFPEGPGRYHVHDLSHDGGLVLISHSTDLASYALYVLDRSSGLLRTVPTFDGLPATARLTGDGARAYFDQPRRGAPDATDIYVWQARTGQSSLVALPDPSPGRPSYRLADVSPDGSAVAAVAGPDVAAGGFLVFDPASGAHRRLVHACDAQASIGPAVSAAGVVACVTGTGALVVHGEDGTPVELREPGAGDPVTAVRTSGDGAAVLWLQPADGGVAELVVVDLASGDRRTDAVGLAGDAHHIDAVDDAGGVVVVSGPAGTRIVMLAPVLQRFADVPVDHAFFEPISWAAAQRITTGYPDGTFSPGAPVSRQAMVAFLHRLAGAPAPRPVAGGVRFTDVPATQPFFHAIEWAAAEGIVGGYPDGTFRPAQDVSRQAMAAFLHGFAGAPPVSVGPPTVPTFADVPPDHPFHVAVEWAHANGVTGGYADGTFRPQGGSTRQAAAAFLYRFAAAG